MLSKNYPDLIDAGVTTWMKLGENVSVHQVEESIGPGDVIFVPSGAVHQIRNDGLEEPLVVVFFMASPELVALFRAIHERVTSKPDHPITPEEIAELEERTGGGKTISK